MQEHFPAVKNAILNFENVLVNENGQLNFKVKETLAELTQMGYKLMLLMDYSHLVYERLYANINAETLLQKLEIREYFSAVYTKDSLDFQIREDKAKLINFIVNKEQLPINQWIMIGSQKQDVVNARKNKLDCIIVNKDYLHIESLLQAKAHTYIDEFCLISGL